MTCRRLRRLTTTGLFVLLFALSVEAQLAVPVTPVDLGPVAAAARVSVRLYLVPDPQRVAALDQFLLDVQDPSSPTYRHWLKTAEFGARFGAASSVPQVRAFAEDAGLAVSDVAPSGLRVTLSGTATQIEATFAPALHAFQAGSAAGMAATATPRVPRSLATTVSTISGFDTLDADPLTLLGDAADANTQSVVALSSSRCAGDLSEADRDAFRLEAKQAAAEGITVLATSGCVTTGGASFPAALSEVTAIAGSSGIVDLPLATELRPQWQWAPGLPADGLRHSPDFAVADLNAFTQTLSAIAASMPAAADRSPVRLGNINKIIYAMGPISGVFTHADGAPVGTWEAGTGLGTLDLHAFAQFFPRGSNTVNVSGSASNYAPTHGQAITLMSTVSDISGVGGGVVPTGTISFTTSTGIVLGTATMVNGTASITTSMLPGGTVDLIPSYSGDSHYAAGQGYGIFLSVQGEPVALTAAVGGAVDLGGNSTVAVTVTSASGFGTPTGSVTVTPQGIGTSPTYTAPLSGTGGTATATVTVPALQAGAIVMLVNCVSADPSFTCYSPIRVTAVVKQAPSTLSFTVSPDPPAAGVITTFVGTVGGAASPAPAPTGSVSFYDNGALLGKAALASGNATYTNTSVGSSTATHAFSASYAGDVNYLAANAANPAVSAPVVTTTTLAVAPNPPVNGSPTTLTATLGYTSNGVPATGAVQFYEDSSLIGTGTVNSAGLATFSSSTITGSAPHSFYAAYMGDSAYAASRSTPVTTQANTATITTTTSVSASSTTVNPGSLVTLTATVVPTSNGGAAPTGTVTFTSSTQGVLGTAALSGSTAVLSVALTTAGAQAITASYSGDATYKASATPAAVTITVAIVTTPIALTVTPLTGASYSTPVTATVAVSGVSTTTGTGPAGSVVFSVGSAGTALPTTATVLLTPSSTTAGVATYTFPAPAPGTYTVTATCTGVNFTCTATPATATLVTVKGSSSTTVIASPASVIAGQTTTLTATISPVSLLATSNAFTGTVTFYNAGAVALGMGTVSGNLASLTTTFTSSVGNIITAVYSGDADWNLSTSAALPLDAALVATNGAISSSLSTTLQGNNVVFTANISDAPSTLFPTPGPPLGQVTFYDQFNGQSIPLGSATLAPNAAYSATAQFSTTGLFAGVHHVTAVFAGGTVYGPSTSAVQTVNVTDYSVTFAPQSLSVTRGSSATTTLTLTGISGFAGTVTLSCTPPAGTLTTCSASPTTLTAGGTAILAITTTASHANGSQSAGLRGLGFGASFAALFGLLLLPRRRRPALLAILALCGLFSAGGCGSGSSSTTTIGGTDGSPLGTQVFTVVAAGSDGVSTSRHTYQLQVTIQ